MRQKIYDAFCDSGSSRLLWKCESSCRERHIETQSKQHTDRLGGLSVVLDVVEQPITRFTSCRCLDNEHVEFPLLLGGIMMTRYVVWSSQKTCLLRPLIGKKPLPPKSSCIYQVSICWMITTCVSLLNVYTSSWSRFAHCWSQYWP